MPAGVCELSAAAELASASSARLMLQPTTFVRTDELGRNLLLLPLLGLERDHLSQDFVGSSIHIVDFAAIDK